MIRFDNLGFAYPEGKMLFSHLSMTIQPGQVVCILGPNGVGKTTLLNCMAKLLTPTQGSIFLEGKNLNTLSPLEIARVVSYVPQFIFPTFSYEVLSYVVTGLAPYIGLFEKPKEEHYQVASDALKQLRIEHLSHYSYTELSGGERHMVSIARAIAQKTKVILMDEPTAHLDYGNQIRVLSVIQQMIRDGYTIILTTHHPDHALLLNGFIVSLNNEGEFHFGPSQEILTESFLQDLYKSPLKLCYIPEVGRKVCIIPKMVSHS